jgi:undecaprenyl-diphosphatase
LTGFLGVSRNDLLSLLRERRREVGLIAAFAVVAALILVFGLLAEEVLEGDTAGFDRAIFTLLRGSDALAPSGPRWLTEFTRDVTALGSMGIVSFVAFATVCYLLLTGRRALAVLMAVAVAGGMLLNTLLKHWFDRPRPDIPHDVAVFTASFPSGHATLSAITYLTLAALLARVHADRRVKAYFVTLAIFLAVAIGVSRVYLGVHYASDVLAGWCIGSAWSILCWTVALGLQHSRRLEPRSEQR